jgi:hypothetical protein
METYLGSQKRARHNLCLCAHLRVHAMRVRACVRSHIFGRISSKIGENIPLRGLHAFYVRTCVCTICAHYAHYARACTACIIYIYICALTHFRTKLALSKLLRVTESCMGYLIFTCALACARYAHACTHMRACVHLHIFGCILSKFGGDIPLHGLHAFYTCVCALCTHYARTISMPVLHACARSHIYGRIFSKLSGTFYGSQRYA